MKIIRAIEVKYDHPIAILADLQGPKLRVGTFKDDAKVMLADGQKFTFDLKDIPGDSNRVRMPHPEILNTLRVGPCNLFVPVMIDFLYRCQYFNPTFILNLTISSASPLHFIVIVIIHCPLFLTDSYHCYNGFLLSLHQ